MLAWPRRCDHRTRSSSSGLPGCLRTVKRRTASRSRGCYAGLPSLHATLHQGQTPRDQGKFATTGADRPEMPPSKTLLQVRHATRPFEAFNKQQQQLPGSSRSEGLRHTLHEMPRRDSADNFLQRNSIRYAPDGGGAERGSEQPREPTNGRGPHKSPGLVPTHPNGRNSGTGMCCMAKRAWCYPTSQRTKPATPTRICERALYVQKYRVKIRTVLAPTAV